jgi:predicted TIM-barrel fold metal-dependent hydrolase
VPVVFHVSNSGYQDLFGVHWGERADNPSHRQSPLQWAICSTERPIVDTLAALTLHNLFGRFPKLQVVSIENGAEWLAHLFEVVDKAAALGHRGPWLGGSLTDRPSEILRDHLYVCPFPEEDTLAAIHALGPDRVLFGSDYPHPEGLREPIDFAERLRDCDEDTARKVMRDNTGGILGLVSSAARRTSDAAASAGLDAGAEPY